MIEKCCEVCGNYNIFELDKVLLYSDGEGNEGLEVSYICKEGKGCCEC